MNSIVLIAVLTANCMPSDSLLVASAPIDEPEEYAPEMETPLLDSPVLASNEPEGSRPRTNNLHSRPGTASTQFMITHKMKAQLVDLGYDEREVRVLHPERARVIIAHSIRRPSRGIPKEWQRVAGSPGSGRGNLVDWLRPLKLAFGPALLACTALYAADPKLFHEILSHVHRFAHGSIAHVRRRFGLQQAIRPRRSFQRGGQR